MTEAELQRKGLARLRAFGGHWINIHGGAYQMPGVFDLISCFEGRFVTIEWKRPFKYDPPTKGMTPAQWSFFSQIKKNGGDALCTDNVDEAVEFMEAISRRRH